MLAILRWCLGPVCACNLMKFMFVKNWMRSKEANGAPHPTNVSQESFKGKINKNHIKRMNLQLQLTLFFSDCYWYGLTIGLDWIEFECRVTNQNECTPTSNGWKGSNRAVENTEPSVGNAWINVKSSTTVRHLLEDSIWVFHRINCSLWSLWSTVCLQLHLASQRFTHITKWTNDLASAWQLMWNKWRLSLR